jgi:hypothetical protein
VTTPNLNGLMLTMIGTMAAVGGAYLWYRIDRENTAAFDAAFSEHGFPRDKAALRRFAGKVRMFRSEDIREALEAQAKLQQLEQHAAAATGLQQCYDNLFDPAVDPQVALWMFSGALETWMRLFAPRFLIAETADSVAIGEEFLADILAVRSVEGTGKRWRMTIVEVDGGSA